MKVTHEMVELICKLERVIGENCYNPNSYNGWTGEEGCGYRYPVKYCKNSNGMYLESTKWTINDIDADMISTMKYVFGTNHLFIGTGIVNALKVIENRYGIDFNELENQFQERNRNEKNNRRA